MRELVHRLESLWAEVDRLGPAPDLALGRYSPQAMRRQERRLRAWREEGAWLREEINVTRDQLRRTRAG